MDSIHFRAPELVQGCSVSSAVGRLTPVVCEHECRAVTKATSPQEEDHPLMCHNPGLMT